MEESFIIMQQVLQQKVKLLYVITLVYKFLV
jgi:hypothetical protein